jgi:hypothetical protein
MKSFIKSTIEQHFSLHRLNIAWYIAAVTNSAMAILGIYSNLALYYSIVTMSSILVLNLFSLIYTKRKGLKIFYFPSSFTTAVLLYIPFVLLGAFSNVYVLSLSITASLVYIIERLYIEKTLVVYEKQIPGYN